MNRFCAVAFLVMMTGVVNVKAQYDPVSADTKASYASVKDVLLRAADKMPEENYSFRTTPQVRTYGEMIAHIVDAQTAFCATVKGEQKRGNAAGKTSKAELSAALKASFDYCDQVYDSMTDAAGAQIVKMQIGKAKV